MTPKITENKKNLQEISDKNVEGNQFLSKREI